MTTRPHTGTTIAPAPSAPIYSSHHYLHYPVRIPPHRDLLGLKNAKPWWIPILDTATLVAPGIVDGALGPQQSVENNFLMTVDFAWLASIFSDVTEAEASAPTFNFQMSRTWKDSQGNEQTYLFQKTPIQAENFFGINQADVPALDTALPGSTPFYLRKPLLFRAGDEILVRVQSLQQVEPQTLQLILFGYIEGR
jgi:hypothetical protein